MNISSAPCDLHVHSYYSDGVLMPSEIVRRAVAAGLAAVSITDHDTVSGQAEALETGKDLPIEVVTGVEFTVMEKGTEIHILGYHFDPEDEGMVSCTRSRELSRRDRAAKILDRLSDIGVTLDIGEVEKESGEGAIGRLHIAKLLREKGYVTSIQEAFDRYIGSGRPAFVERKVLGIEEAVSVIRGGGGAAVWAHPGQAIRRTKLVARIVGAGISGLEAYHPNHTPDLVRLVCGVARRQGLVCTGGSDFHFVEVMKADIGGVTVPYEAVLELKERAGDI